MSFLKPKKQDRGEYTVFLTVAGEVKMKKGEPVLEETNKIDPVTGEKEMKEVLNKHTFLNIVKNYGEGEEKPDEVPRYTLFASYRTDEKDYVERDEEKKSKILSELNFNEDTMEFVGTLRGKNIRIPMANEADRILQAYEVIEDGSLPF